MRAITSFTQFTTFYFIHTEQGWLKIDFSQQIFNNAFNFIQMQFGLQK